MREAARQLALELPHAESFRRDDFLPNAANEAALALVDSWPEWPGPFAAIAGPAGSGKSHLAAIWAERSGARIADAASLRNGEVQRALVTGALVIEDFSISRVDQTAIFHLLNLARETSAFVLFTMNSRLELEGAQIPDLASRLRAMAVLQLSAPDDALIAAVLVKLFADRQMTIDEDTIAFLLPRMERSLASAKAMVDRLDRVALSRGRRITRILASEVLRAGETSL
jgi:chromosomal replication initiation ATPase DnaA